jgi:hypothetical protein
MFPTMKMMIQTMKMIQTMNKPWFPFLFFSISYKNEFKHYYPNIG